ncbi:MAG: hypothetical protein VBE63_15325 [Lamprobacter sp.]|uniref:hypothetical protein n=1 Tax=Lamprobacter sp. TaxID=3100796 RepID=UPI002B257A91|nr:hypothetical protein [Lamprobacter sp.]MEA3641295.1 hypothetical protein [Lamprobacter sp.]
MPLLSILLLLLAGCATPEYMLSGFTDVPKTCAEIDAELRQSAKQQALSSNLTLGKTGLITGISVAAAAGALPVGFAWAPLFAIAIQPLQPPSKADRIYHLARVREIRDCQPLQLTQ